MITRLGLHGGPRGLYGSFSGKTPGSPVVSSVVTRLGLYGGPRAPYGSFAGKTPGVGGGFQTAWAANANTIIQAIL
jgi:hypothetical protein